MIDSVIHTNQHSIDRVLGAGMPVALIFWRNGALNAAQDEKLDSTARRYAGRALVVKVNAQDEPDLAKRFGVTTTPAAVIVQNAQPIDKSEAAEIGTYVEGWLDHLVLGKPKPAAKPQAATAQSAPNGSAKNDGHPITLTDATFQSAVNRDVPVLVDFWAEWCPPCRMVAPVVEQLAREFAGRAVVAKLNVDENPATAQRYQVMSIPTLFIFKRGAVVEQIVGAQPAQVLRDRLARHAG